MAIVTLTTDFGTVDGYVGEMKGVLLSLTPSARPVDVTHAIAQGDVRGGAWVLGRIWRRFPPETVHLAVVDPGVGGDRRAVAARVDGRWFVGPDNGLLSRVLRQGEAGPARALAPDRAGLEEVSDTFHGRDLFAPAAARLAGGADPARLGPEIDPDGLQRFEVRPARRSGPGEGDPDALRGSVVHVDRFGNLVTDIPTGWLPGDPRVEVGGRTVRRLARSFDAVDPGELVLTRGSVGTLEISVRDGSAAEELGVERGAPVVVRSA